MILISIVGDFHSSVMPVFYHFKDSLSKHIIIYDDYKKDQYIAKKMLNGLNEFNIKYDYDIETIPVCIDEDSFLKIEEISDIVLKHSENKTNIYINITDGLASIGAVLFKNLYPFDVNFITYDRYDNEYNILNKNTSKKIKINQSIPIVDHFLLKDIYIEKIGDKNFPIRYKEEINQLFQEHYEAFNAFPKKKKKKVVNILKQLGFTNPNHYTNAKGYLCECYIFNIVRELGVDDIEMGVLIQENMNDVDYIENEIDILIMKNNHLHMIECKFRNFYPRKNLNIDIYKYINISSILDEDGKILISKKSLKYNDLDPDSEENFSTYKRAKVNNVLIRGIPKNDYELNLFKYEVSKFFNLESNNKFLQTDRLFSKSYFKREIEEFFVRIFNLNQKVNISEIVNDLLSKNPKISFLNEDLRVYLLEMLIEDKKFVDILNQINNILNKPPKNGEDLELYEQIRNYRMKKVLV